MSTDLCWKCDSLYNKTDRVYKDDNGNHICKDCFKESNKEYNFVILGLLILTVLLLALAGIVSLVK